MSVWTLQGLVQFDSITELSEAGLRESGAPCSARRADHARTRSDLAVGWANTLTNERSRKMSALKERDQNVDRGTLPKERQGDEATPQ